MRLIFFSLFLTISFFSTAQLKGSFLCFGIDYRWYPTDIEDASSGPLTPINGSTFGELTDSRFWQVLSIHGRLGIEAKKKWLFSIVCNARYNHNNYIEDPYIQTGPTSGSFIKNTREKKKIKLDVFFDIEKKIRLVKKQEKYLTLLAGLGFTNINSHTSVTYKSNISSEIKTYTGSYLNFGPKFSIGYQYKKIKGSLDTYMIEDPLKSNLTSLWLGATVSYEIRLKNKKR